MKALQQVQDRYQEWELPKMTRDAQKGYLKRTVMKKIVGSLLNNDFVVQVTVPQDLVEPFQEMIQEVDDNWLGEQIFEAIRDISGLDEGSQFFELDAFLDSAEAKQQIDLTKRALTAMRIQGEPVANLVVDGLDQLGHITNDDFFIRILTQSYLMAQTLSKWDKEIGLSESLQGTFVTFDQSEMKLLFGLTKIFESLARRQAKGEAARVAGYQG